MATPSSVICRASLAGPVVGGMLHETPLRGRPTGRPGPVGRPLSPAAKTTTLQATMTGVVLVREFLGLFIRAESTAGEPTVPLRLFRDPTFTISLLGTIICGIVFAGAVQFLALYVQVATGADPTTSGFILLPMMTGLVLSSRTRSWTPSPPRYAVPSRSRTPPRSPRCSPPRCRSSRWVSSSPCS